MIICTAFCIVLINMFCQNKCHINHIILNSLDDIHSMNLDLKVKKFDTVPINNICLQTIAETMFKNLFMP